MWPSPYFLEIFVEEHNNIDPQPGHRNEPGDPHYEDHLETARFMVTCAREGHSPHPLIVHKKLMRNLLGFDREAGQLRRINVAVGGRRCPAWQDVAELLRDWQITVDLFPEHRDKSEEARRDWVWNRHVEFEHIHPFIDGNGRTGRLLMLNHALLLGLEPWYVKYNERYAYYARF